MEPVTQERPAGTWSRNQIALALLGVAFILPVVLLVTGLGSVAFAGGALVFLASIYVISGIVGWLTRRRRQAQAKARNPMRLAMVLVVLSSALASIAVVVLVNARAHEAEFTQLVQTRHAQLGQELVALRKETDAIDLSGALSPQTLVDAQAIDRTRTAIAQYSVLVDRREQALSQYATDVLDKYVSDMYVRKNQLRPSFIDGFLLAFGQHFKSSKQVYDEVNSAQRSLLASYLQMLDFAQRNPAPSGVGFQDGRITFGSRAQAAEYRTIMARVQTAASREATARAALLQLTEDRAHERPIGAIR